MAHTPKSIKVEIDWDRKEVKQALEDAQQVGFQEGLAKGRQEVLDFLEHAYLTDQGRPDRNTPKAEAILEIARAASKHINLKLKKGRK
jgi:hypothetical protein